jgi:hypothetical protein
MRQIIIREWAFVASTPNERTRLPRHAICAMPCARATRDFRFVRASANPPDIRFSNTGHRESRHDHFAQNRRISSAIRCDELAAGQPSVTGLRDR